MPIRLPFKTVQLSPGSILYPYWGPLPRIRPKIDLFAVGPTGLVADFSAQIDSASDFVALAPDVARRVGLHPPFVRQDLASGAGGHPLHLSFPSDGEVSLFVTDYAEFYYLPSPLVGFHTPPLGVSQIPTYRSVLGITGFLQYFKTRLDPDPQPPIVELDPSRHFNGQFGPLPRTGPLLDFIRSLKLSP